MTQEQLVAATAELGDRSKRTLRDRLCELKLLSSAEADAVAAVVRERMARFGGDPKQTLDSVGAAEAAALSRGLSGGGTNAKADSATRDDRFATQAPQAWSYSPQYQRFTVLRLHQQGGLGRLMIAQDRELNREIALKEILPAIADHEDNRRRFIREAEITGALEHPGIVPVYSLGEFPDGRPYYAMRLIRGVDLRTAITAFHATDGGAAQRERPLEFRQLLGRFVDVCHAIHYAHNRGVIHRDIKPGNIMLGDYGETLVVDWGLAKTLDGPQTPDDFEAPSVTTSERASTDQTQLGRIVGTTQYMSPEQAEGRVDRLSPASDIYGLGATLYHLLTGRPPFEGDESDIVLLVQQGRFPSPRTVSRSAPRALEAICLKAMAKKPQDRYPTARELALDVERYLGDERVTAFAEPWHGRAWRWIRRHRAAVMSFMAAAIVAVSALTAGVVLLTAANVRERQARREATENFKEAVAQRERAERNFALAQEAVRNYYVQVSEETLLNQLGMQPLRDALLRQALAYYEKFLAERQDDPALRGEVAQAQYLVGKITETVDSPAAAIPHFEKAAALQKSAVDAAAGGDKRQATADYAQTLNALGRAQQNVKRLDDAKASYAAAAKLREQLAAERPGDAEAARLLASSVMNLGLVELEAGRAAAALPLFDRAQALRAANSDEKSLTATMRRDMGMGHYNIAIAHLQTDDAQSAMANLAAAITQFERLAEENPQDLDNRRRLANCRRIVGDVLGAQQKSEEAIAAYQQARDELASLVAHNPEVPNYAADLAGVRMNLAMQWQATGEPDSALSELEAAVDALQAICENAQASPRYRRDYGVALRALGLLLVDLDRREEGRVELEASKAALGKLVQEQPGEEGFTRELKATIDALAELDAI